MALNDFLVPGEEVVAQSGPFYATNKRLIRYSRFLLVEEWGDIPYAHLSAICLVRVPRRGLIRAGIVVATLVISTLLTLMLLQPILKALPNVGLDFSGFMQPLLLGLALSVVPILVGLFIPATYYEFYASGLSPAAQSRFRLYGVRRRAVKALLQTIRQRSLGLEGEKRGA